jgi:hypothetical protein
MKRTLAAAVMVFSLFFLNRPVEAIERNDRLEAVLKAAPWLESRARLYHCRVELENPPQAISEALFEFCLVPAGASRQQRGFSLAAPVSIGALGEYDPYIKVPQSDSLGSSANLALNSVSNRILLVWQDERNGFADPDIYGQVFDLTYTALGTNIKINPAGIKAAQIAPDVCALANGDFLVCWEDYSTTTPQIMTRVVKPDGTLPMAAVRVSPATAIPQFFPKVDSYGDSTHVTWLQQDGQDYSIFIRTLNLPGVPQAPAVRVNDDDNGLQWAPDIANYGFGQTAVVWEDKRDGNSEIYAQIYKADGVKRGDNFLVNLDPLKSLQWRPAVAGNESMIQVVWEDYQNRAAAIYTQQFDRYGLPNGGQLRLDQSEFLAAKERPSLCADGSGQRVFAWQEKAAEAWHLKFALFPAGSEVPVFYTLGEEDAIHEFTEIKLNQIKNTIFFTFLGQVIGGKSTVLSHKVTFTAVPVELASFQALVEGSIVKLVWQTASETSNYGFIVERLYEGGSFERIGFVTGMGTSSVGQSYLFIDRNPGPGRYRYRLQQVDLDGTATLSDEISVLVGGPDRFELAAVHPNPFKSQTCMTLRLPETAMVGIQVYNLWGQQVSRIAPRILTAGQHQLLWDGRDDAGMPLPSGIYFLQVDLAGHPARMKVTLVR